MIKIVKITYFVHGTTTDNEKNIATGCAPGKLSKLGVKQSIELRYLIESRKFDIIFSSDLKRAVDSARLIFPKAKIIQDKRLRECDYGELTGSEAKKLDALKERYISEPFQNGESYKDVEKRMRKFLNALMKKYPEKRVAIIAHMAPQLALDVILKGKTWKQAMTEDWRKQRDWKPGWEYTLRDKS